jgi:hypothetical protein
MSVAVTPFARTFTSSRERFRAAVERGCGVLERFDHPLTGPNGEHLVCDVARFGSGDAPRLLVLVTGVHGVEHYVGSACVTDWIERRGPQQLPDNTAVLVIHAINPWGAAWFRRYTEDNVDLARNFGELDIPQPAHRAYEDIHFELSEIEPGSAPAFLDSLFARLGDRDAIEALMSGQYSHADGFSFGGTQPCWSHRTIQTILTAQAKKAQSVCLIEFHSGLGDWGTAMPVTMQVGADLQRVVRFFGDAVIAPRAMHKLHSAPGHTTDGYLRFLAGKEVTSIVIETGTYPPRQSLEAMLDDHWLQRQVDPDPAVAWRIREANLEMHCPSDPGWEEMALIGSARVIAQALKGLASA